MVADPAVEAPGGGTDGNTNETWGPIAVPDALRDACQRFPLASIAPATSASMFVPFPSVGRFQIPLLAQRESLKTLDVDPAMFPPTMHDLQANEGIQQALGATDVSYLHFKPFRMNYTPRWPLFGLDASAQTAKEESDVPPDALDFHSAFRSYHQSGIGDRFRQTFGFSASDAANATVAGPTAPHWQPVAAPAPVKEAQSPTQAQAPRESAADRKRPAPNTSQTSKRPRPESGDDLVAPIVESGAEVKVIAAAAPPTEREQEQIDGDIDNLDELIEEQPEEVEAPKKKRKTTHVQIQPELPKDPLVALGKAKKLIDDIIDEWDNFDAFAADDDAPADVMQDAHQRKQASNRKAEDDDRNHFVFRSTDDRGPALISAESLAKLTYAIDKVNEAGKIKELGDAIDGGVQGLLKIMQWVDNWVHLPGIRLELDKTANRLKSRPQPLGEAGDGQAADQEDALDSASLSEALKRAKTSLDASYLSLSVMVGGAGKLERRVYSEDLIVAVLDLLKHHLEHIIRPFVQGQTGSEEHTPVHKWIHANRSQLASFSARLGDCLVKLGQLFSSREALDESVVISATYTGLKAFFWQAHNDSMKDTTRGTALGRLQLSALDLIKSVFAHHPARRVDILSEILSSLGTMSPTTNKLSVGQKYLLPDGRSIAIWSAVVLECLQSTCEITVERANGLIEALQKDMEREVAQTMDEAPGEMDRKTPSKKKKGKKKDLEAVDPVPKLGDARETSEPHFARLQELLRSQLDAAATCASFFIHYLVSRAFPHREKDKDNVVSPVKGKGKKGAGGGGRKDEVNNESEYKNVLETWITDLCTTLDAPEWPVASMTFLVACKMVVQVLEDPLPTRTAAARQSALDILGNLVARLRQREIVVKNCESIADVVARFPHAEVKDMDQESHFAALGDVQKGILSFLVIESKTDTALRSAESYFLTDWISRLLANASSEANSVSRVTSGTVVRTMFTELLQKLCAHARPAERIAMLATQEHELVERGEAIALIALHTLHSSRSVFDTFLTKILYSLDQSSNQLRGKALRALGDIITVDSTVLNLPYVRTAVEQRIHDPGPTVREASIELVQKYAFASKDLTLIRNYFDVVADRAGDTSTMVRKRALRFLKEAYLELSRTKLAVAQDLEQMVMASSVFISRGLTDEEATVKDLALNSLQECWLGLFADHNLAAAVRHAASGNGDVSTLLGLGPVGRKELADRLRSIVATTQHLQDRNMVGDAFIKMLAKDRTNKIGTCQLLVHALVEQALTASELEKEAALVTLQQISRAEPTLAGHHLATLHPFLKFDAIEAKNKDEPIVVPVLRIFQAALPLSSSSRDAGFVERVQADLFALLSQGNTATVRAAVPCLAVLANEVTHDWHGLATRLMGTFRLLRTAAEKLKTEGIPKQSFGNIYRCILVWGLLVRDVDFDRHRLQDPSLEAAFAPFVKGSVKECLFLDLLSIARTSEDSYETIRVPALESLGHLFTTVPQLMLREDSRTLMDSIFSTDSPKMLQQLLLVLRTLMDTEARRGQSSNAKTGSIDGQVDRAILTGTAEELGHAGISGSVMQTYLDRVLNVLTRKAPALRALAFEVLERTLEQGLVMPAICIPALVAVECSEDRILRERAVKLHTKLSEKHASIINMKNMDAARMSFECLRAWAGVDWVPGFRQFGPSDVGAMLMPLYTIVRSKKPQRTEFLSGLVKLFDLEPGKKDASLIDVPFLKYVAENLASFHYEKQEEILTVIYTINRVASITSTGVVAFGEKVMHAEGRDDEQIDWEGNEALFMVEASKSMGMLLVLRKFLQSLYKLSHERCATFKPNEGARAQERPVSRDPKVSTIISWEEVPLLEHDMDAVAKQTAQLQQFMNLMNNDFVLLDEDGEVAGHYHDADVSGEEAIARESAEEGQDHAPKRKAGKPKQAVQRKRKPPPAKGAKKTAPKPRRQTKNAFVESDGDEELNLDDEPEPSSSSSEDSDA